MRGRRRGLVTVGALVVAMLLPAPGGAAPIACATPMPVDDVAPGMTGVGYTVAAGEDIEPFAVEVLGVLRDGLAPGRDVIVVDTDSARLTAAGGVWAGMSGSPVYIGDRLVGAISYGFSFGASMIAGLTPAEDMLDLYGTATATGRRMATVEVPDGRRMEFAREAGIPVARVPRELRRLPTPLGMSGVPSRLVDRMADALDHTGTGLRPHVGATTAASHQAVSAIGLPGSTLTAMLSSGDVTFSAAGTLTDVCNGEAVGFGHPLFFSGDTALAAGGGQVAAVIDDPFGPFKLVQGSAPFGTVDQDRLAGIRVDLGGVPDAAGVTSTVRDLDRGRSRDGRTDVYHRDWIGDIAATHVVANIDTTQDRVGAGSSEITFAVEGTDADGDPWRLERSNRAVSDSDISYETPFELFLDLLHLQHNPFESVEITHVDVDVDVQETPQRFTIQDVETSTDGGETWTTGFEVIATAGTDLLVRTTLRDALAAATRKVVLSLPIPADAAFLSGSLDVSGGRLTGGDPFECLFDPMACGAPGADSLDDLLEALASAPRADDLVASLLVYDGEVFPEDPVGEFDGDGPVVVADDPGGGLVDPTVAQVRERLDQVVDGYASIPVWVQPADGGGPGGGAVTRVHGTDRTRTAVALSRRVFRDGAGTAVLARADQYADALAAAPLAARMGGPVLLTGRDELPTAVGRELERLGVTEVVVVGGESAISPTVVQQVRATGVPRVARLAGTSRFDTARLIAMRLGGDRVYVTEGANADAARGWPDALGAAGLAALEQRPVLLVEHDRLPEETAAALRDLTVVGATIVGGPVAVSADVAGQIDAIVDDVDRVGGATRYHTSVQLARRALQAGADPWRVFVATGRDFPDALGAGPVVAATAGILVLVDGQDPGGAPPVRSWIRSLAGQPVELTIVGGPRAVTNRVEGALASWLGVSPTSG